MEHRQRRKQLNSDTYARKQKIKKHFFKKKGKRKRKRKKNEKIGFTRKILDDFQGLPLLL